MSADALAIDGAIVLVIAALLYFAMTRRAK